MGISAQGAEHLTNKIGRAYKHAKEFDALFVAHCRRNDLFTATTREENGRYVVRVEYAPQDGDINLSLADFAYNLRSGLDQLAWQLCLAGGGTPGRNTMFPIFEKDDPPHVAFARAGNHSVRFRNINVALNLNPILECGA